ncbi:hypothetical protein BRN87_24085, partial [Xanthomonas oryzae pv. oryzae]
RADAVSCVGDGMSRARDVPGADVGIAACLADTRLCFLPSAFAMRLHARALRVTRVGHARLLPVASRQEH